MTIAQQIFNECKQTLQSLNYDVGEVFFEFTAEIGSDYAGVKTIGYKKYVIQFTPKFDLEKENHRDVFKSTVYHELCHCLTLNIGFKSNLFTWNSEKSKYDIIGGDREFYLAMKVCFKDEGHTAYWQKFANNINAILNLKYPITAKATKEVVQIMNEYYGNLNIRDANKVIKNSDGSYSIINPIFIDPIPTNLLEDSDTDKFDIIKALHELHLDYLADIDAVTSPGFNYSENK